VADETPRPPEAEPADELAMDRAWLEHLRTSVIHKLAGLDDDALRWKPAPTANSLGQIAVHLGYAERLWLRAICDGEPMDMGWREHMFELPDGWGVDEVVAFYRAETAASDHVLDRVGSLDERSRGPIRSTTFRWALVHVIEETARHAGHMDITRELLDGQIGR
jgi:uncharacterized damage-inducible protein DinB